MAPRLSFALSWMPLPVLWRCRKVLPLTKPRPRQNAASSSGWDNLGDVVVEGDDLFGDGVNVAARLEQLCPPGGVLISGTAYDQMKGKLNLPIDYAGEQRVKNFSELTTASINWFG